MNLSPNDKIAGVLSPLFALRTEDDLGIGDVAALRQFIDWVRGIGFKLVQLLPINESGGDNSPYNAISSRAIDPTTLQLAPGVPEDLSEDAFAEVTAGTDLSADPAALVQQLHRDHAVQIPLAGLEDDPHSSAGDFFQELVVADSAGERPAG